MGTHTGINILYLNVKQLITRVTERYIYFKCDTIRYFIVCKSMYVVLFTL